VSRLHFSLNSGVPRRSLAGSHCWNGDGVRFLKQRLLERLRRASRRLHEGRTLEGKVLLLGKHLRIALLEPGFHGSRPERGLLTHWLWHWIGLIAVIDEKDVGHYVQAAWLRLFIIFRELSLAFSARSNSTAHSLHHVGVVRQSFWEARNLLEILSIARENGASDRQALRWGSIDHGSIHLSGRFRAFFAFIFRQALVLRLYSLFTVLLVRLDQVQLANFIL